MTSRGVLLDTHIAIWLVTGELASSALAAIDAASNGGNLLVSTVSAWEVGLLAQPRGGDTAKLMFLPDPQT